MHIWMGQIHFSEVIFSLRGVRGTQRPYCKFGTRHISEIVRARKLKFYTHVDRASALVGYENFPLAACEGCSTPSVNLGPLISRKLLELES